MSKVLHVAIAKSIPEGMQHNVHIPQYATDGAACLDLHAFMLPAEDSYAHINPGTPTVIRTGLEFQVPEGHVMLIFSRSGHGFKNDIRLANCVGVIDSDYRGEVMVKLTNDNSDGQFITVRHGDRIAQAMLVEIPRVKLEVVQKLSETTRGEGGFGSTGTNSRSFIGMQKEN